MLGRLGCYSMVAATVAHLEANCYIPDDAHRITGQSKNMQGASLLVFSMKNH